MNYILIVTRANGLIAHVSGHKTLTAAQRKAEKIGSHSKVNLFGKVFYHSPFDPADKLDLVYTIAL